MRKSYPLLMTLILLLTLSIAGLLLMGCGGGGGTTTGISSLESYLGVMLYGDVIKLDVDTSAKTISWENETTHQSGTSSYTEVSAHTMQCDGFNMSNPFTIHKLTNAMVGVVAQNTERSLFVAFKTYPWGNYTRFRNALLGKTFVGIGIEKDSTGALMLAQIDTNGNVTLYKGWYQTALDVPYTSITATCDNIDLNTMDGCYEQVPNFLPPTMSADMSFDGQKLTVNTGSETMTLMAFYLDSGKLVVVVDHGANNGIEILVEASPSESAMNIPANAVNNIYKLVSAQISGTSIILNTTDYTDYYEKQISATQIEVRKTSDDSVHMTLTLQDNSSNWSLSIKATGGPNPIYIVPVSTEMYLWLASPSAGIPSAIGINFKVDSGR